MTTQTTLQPRPQIATATRRGTVTLTGVEPTRDVYVFVADLRAHTRPEPAALRERSRRLAAALLACGLDGSNVHVYRQSRVPAVAELAAL